MPDPDLDKAEVIARTMMNSVEGQNQINGAGIMSAIKQVRAIESLAEAMKGVATAFRLGKLNLTLPDQHVKK